MDTEIEQFVAAQSRPLLAFAYALTGNPHDAWDLTQETVVRVAERWSRLTGAPAAYARVVMVRLNIDRVRRLRRELLPGSVPDQAAEAPWDPTDQLDPWLVAGLATLSPRQRTALALRHVDDLDVAGIAERMGCSVGTAKSHLSRGTERLREHAATVGATRAGVPTPTQEETT